QPGNHQWRAHSLEPPPRRANLTLDGKPGKLGVLLCLFQHAGLQERVAHLGGLKMSRLLCIVEVHVGASDLIARMSAVRQWLDRQRYEPDLFHKWFALH